MSFPRKIIGVTLMVVVMVVVQQIFLAANGAFHVYAQGVVTLGYVDGTGIFPRQVPIEWEGGDPDDLQLDFSFSYDNGCIGFLAFNPDPAVDPSSSCVTNSGSIECSIAAPLPFPEGSLGELSVLQLCDGPLVFEWDVNNDFCEVVDNSLNIRPCTVSTDTPLAVTLSYFFATRNDDTLTFRWQTAIETGTGGFNILAETAVCVK